MYLISSISSSSSSNKIKAYKWWFTTSRDSIHTIELRFKQHSMKAMKSSKLIKNVIGVHYQATVV